MIGRINPYLSVNSTSESTTGIISRDESKANSPRDTFTCVTEEGTRPADATLIDSIQQLLTNEKWQDI